MRPVFLLLFASSCFAACTQPRAPMSRSETMHAAMATAERPTHILNRDVPWFEHPAQARPADGQLKANTRVLILQDTGTFSQVRTEDGQVCFVVNSALTPLPRP